MKEFKVDSRYLKQVNSRKINLSEEDLKFFEENGFVLCKGLLSSEHLEPLVYEFATEVYEGVEVLMFSISCIPNYTN